MAVGRTDFHTSPRAPIELQPYTWKTVKVSFNYESNDVLSETDTDDSVELKVYHLEEVKDEEGNKTDEIEIKEVVVNEKASSDWEIVVEASVFSTYSVAAVKAPLRAVNETPASCFTYSTITLSDWSMWIHITNYTVNANNGCTTDVVIPEYIDWYPVVWLSYYTDYDPEDTHYSHDWAFENKWLTSVVLPSKLQAIWKYTFYQNNLTSVNIPASVTKIESISFNENDFPCDSAIIYARNNGWEDRTKLVSFASTSCPTVTIPEWVTTIEDRAFRGAWISTLTLPNTLEVIKAMGFYGNNFRTVTIPAWVSTLLVGASAFATSNVTCTKANSATQVLSTATATQWNNYYWTYLSCVSAASSYMVYFNTYWWTDVQAQTFNNNTSNVTVPSAPSKTWYQFNRWYYYNTNGNQTTFDTATRFSTLFWNTIRIWWIYAEWIPNVYTINFDAGNVNAQWSVSPISAIYDVYYSAPDNWFSAIWYSFIWWNSDVNWNWIWYQPWNELLNLTWVSGAIVPLYAQWWETLTVTFESNGWSDVESQILGSWSTATQPDNPRKTWYAFVGRFSDSWLNSEFNFDTPITSNTTLYAKWEERYIPLVTFDSMWWSTVPSQDVEYGERVIRPDDPIKDNQGFKYWTTDSEWNNQYDFNTPVTWDLILYAQWGNICTVTFANGRCYRNQGNQSTCNFTLPASIQVTCGTPLRRPDDPQPFSTQWWWTSYTYYFSRWSDMLSYYFSNYFVNTSFKFSNTCFISIIF